MFSAYTLRFPSQISLQPDDIPAHHRLLVDGHVHQHTSITRWQIRHVPRSSKRGSCTRIVSRDSGCVLGERLTNILGCLDTPELHERFAGAVQGFGDGGGGFGFALGADNGCLSFLFSLREKLISDR